MAKLHIFNPEHDIALASNLANFTAPHAGRLLRADLGWIAAIWADAGDFVWVEDAEHAERTYRRTLRRRKCPVQWIDKKGVHALNIDAIEPWGWDAALCRQLTRADVDAALLPSALDIADIRMLSHRQTAARQLKELTTWNHEALVGEATLCETVEAVENLLARHGRLVLKAPWSSSGRGIRFVEQDLDNYHHGWLRNLLAAQGGVMVEPYYDKVKDFAMEFSGDGQGGIRNEGLSLFHTENGAYTGNVIATETKKREMISRYVSTELLDGVQERICATQLLRGYAGPFGVDMMVVTTSSPSPTTQLHPCVEINLRRTMGHVALALNPGDDDIVKVMRIRYDGKHYQLNISKLQ